MLDPSEAPGITAALASASIPTKPLRMNPEKMAQGVGPALQALCSKDAELKVSRVMAARFSETLH